MNRRLTTLMLVAIGVLSLMGCVRAAWIKQDTNGVGGIPFFVKRAIYRHTSVYEVRWLDVTLEVTPVTPDAKPPTDTKPATDAKPVAEAKPAIDAKPPIAQLLTTRAEAGSQALADLRRVLVKASSREPGLNPHSTTS